MTDRIRVAVIDDHPLFREGVAHTIRSSKVLEVVAEGSCADDAIRIVKDEVPDIVLLDVSMRAVARGESYVSPSLAARLLTMSRRTPQVSNEDSDRADLTPREEGILDHVALGMTNKEIARRLSISEKTVKHYMTNIMQKLHVRNRVEAVLAFQRKPARAKANT